MLDGNISIDCANMMGITPAVFTRRGMCVLWPPYMRLPITRLAYCTGIFLIAWVITITPAMIITISAIRKISVKSLSDPTRKDSKVRTKSFGYLAMMPVKIIRDIPLPMPFSEICSPSHIRNIVPDVSVTIVSSLNGMPPSGTIGLELATGMFSRKSEIPYA